jgi:hypothetical protein
MGVLFGEVRNKKLSEIDVGKFLTAVMSTMRKYRVQVMAVFFSAAFIQ